MWTSTTMSFFDSLVTFSIGFSIVFICLISLALFIIIASKIINIVESSVNKKENNTVNNIETKKTNEVVSSHKMTEEDNELLAVIIGSISEEMKEPIDNFKIVNIKEL